MNKLKLSINEIIEATGESRGVLYAAINAGDLKTFLVGRRRFARPDDVRAWVDWMQAQSDAGTPVVYAPRSKERSAA